MKRMLHVMGSSSSSAGLRATLIIRAEAMRLPCSTPVFSCKGQFIGAADGDVDSRRAHAGVPEPALHEVERHSGLQRPDAEGVAQASWTSGASGNPRSTHHAFD